MHCCFVIGWFKVRTTYSASYDCQKILTTLSTIDEQFSNIKTCGSPFHTLRQCLDSWYWNTCLLNATASSRTEERKDKNKLVILNLLPGPLPMTLLSYW